MQNYSVNKWLRKTMSIFTIQASILIMTCSITLAHDNYAQVLDREVTVSLKEVKFKNALIEIEKVAHIKFVYSDEQMPLSTIVSLIAERRKLNELLTDLLQPHGINFEADDNTEFVVLKRIKKKTDTKESMREGDLQSPKDEVKYASVSGIVTDEITGQPLAGVNVIIKGTTNGTSTDATGRYVINAEGGNILVFSFIGYISQEISINGRTLIDLALKEDVKSLNEVTVNAGYWNVKERENTGNIAKVSSDIISKQPVSNPLSALMGRMPGVYISQSSGLPGSAFNIQIRGQNSLRQSLTDNGNAPLYLVDGVPYLSTSLASRNFSSAINYGNPLNALNPSDIESIEILKDADATAIYGSRGANGVVLITTKKGKSGKTKVDFDYYQGVGKASKFMELLNTQQYLEMRKEAFRNDTETIQPYHFDMGWDSTRNVDWQKELLGGVSGITNAQLSISGGNENTQVLFGLGFFREGTILPGDFDYKKFSSHFNVNHQSANKKFRVAFSSNLVKDINNPGGDPTAAAVVLPPNMPALVKEDGGFNWENPSTYNPLASLLNKFTATNLNYIGNVQMGYKLTDELELKSSFGYNKLDMNELRTAPIRSFDPSWGLTTGEATYSKGNTEGWIIEPQLDFKKSINDWSFNILVGSTFQNNISESQSLYAIGFLSDNSLENPAAASNVFVNEYRQTTYRYAALFARGNVNWKGKYIINLTARRDGSSRFGPGNQFGNFGAVGLAWVFSNEDFVREHLGFISFGKIRSSYGTTGSDQIPDYGYLDSFSYSSYSYLGSRGLEPSRIANPNYSWEVNKKFEGALELGFLQDRIRLSTSYYFNRSSNQLVGFPLPDLSGFTSVQQNLAATVENTGIEFDLSSLNLTGANFSWSTSFNISLPKNRLVAYPDINKSSYATTYSVGKSLFTKYTFVDAGVNPETGSYTFKDINDDGSVSFALDGQFTKRVAQTLYGGISNTFSYKGIQLDIFFQVVRQTGRTEQSLFSTPGAYGNQPVTVLDRWQEPGDKSSVQKFTQSSSSSYLRWINSDGAIEDTSFIRLKNVSLSYNLPALLIQKIKLNRCKVFVQGQNLITLTKYKGFNPETGSLSLPPLKVFTAGLSISL